MSRINSMGGPRWPIRTGEVSAASGSAKKFEVTAPESPLNDATSQARVLASSPFALAAAKAAAGAWQLKRQDSDGEGSLLDALLGGSSSNSTGISGSTVASTPKPKSPYEIRGVTGAGIQSFGHRPLPHFPAEPKFSPDFPSSLVRTPPVPMEARPQHPLLALMQTCQEWGLSFELSRAICIKNNLTATMPNAVTPDLVAFTHDKMASDPTMQQVFSTMWRGVTSQVDRFAIAFDGGVRNAQKAGTKEGELPKMVAEFIVSEMQAQIQITPQLANMMISKLATSADFKAASVAAVNGRIDLRG